MKVKYYRLWEDHTWDVGVMDIPDNTPEYEIENFIRNKRIETFITHFLDLTAQLMIFQTIVEHPQFCSSIKFGWLFECLI